MATINLTPLLASIAGTEQATRATFTATPMQAGKAAIRVLGPIAIFATPYIAKWDGSQWDRPPSLDSLPVGDYWAVQVTVGALELAVNVIVPTDTGPVDFGELIHVTPDSEKPDQSTVLQVQALQAYASNVLNEIRSVASEIRDVQASIHQTQQETQ